MPGPASRAAARGPGLAIVLAVLFGISGMGSAAVAVAVPAIGSDLRVPTTSATLVVSCYALSLAVSSAVFGWLGDRYGIRRPMMIGITGMALAALGATLADDLATLVALRVLQGMGAAAIPALTLTALLLSYEGRAQRAALATYTGVFAAVNAVGPVIGATLVDLAGWQPVIALAIVALPLVAMAAPALPDAGDTSIRLDAVGTALVVALATGVILALQAGTLGPTTAAAGALVAAGSLPFAVRHMRRTPDGLMPLQLFTSPPARASLLTAIGVPAGWFALLIGIPAILGQVGWTGVQIGLLLLPGGVLAILSPRLTTPVLDRLGPMLTQALSNTLTVLALGVGAAGITLRHPAVLVGAVLVLTFAFGLGQPAMSQVVGDSVPPHRRGSAMGLQTIVFLGGGSVGAATIGGIGALASPVVALLALAAVPALAAALQLRLAHSPSLVHRHPTHQELT